MPLPVRRKYVPPKCCRNHLQDKDFLGGAVLAVTIPVTISHVTTRKLPSTYDRRTR